MAWYPGATKWELQPESDSQPAIRPTQFIVHSIIAPWTARRTYEFWRDSTNLESHFGIGYEAGDVGQFIGTHTRADANADANQRPDGTGAVSAETASNLQGTAPWTDAQIEELINLGVWLHEEEGIPLRICRTHDDPGFGYHSMFPQWSTSGTACPGKARIAQFKKTVFPGIVARANGVDQPSEEDPMAGYSKNEIGDAVLYRDHIEAPADDPNVRKNPFWSLASYIRSIYNAANTVRTEQRATDAKIDALTKAVAELTALVKKGA